MLKVHLGVVPKDPATVSAAACADVLAALPAITGDAAAQARAVLLDRDPALVGHRMPDLVHGTALDSWTDWGAKPAADLSDGVRVFAIVDGKPSGPSTNTKFEVLPGDWDIELVTEYALALRDIVTSRLPEFELDGHYRVTSIFDAAITSGDFSIHQSLGAHRFARIEIVRRALATVASLVEPEKPRDADTRAKIKAWVPTPTDDFAYTALRLAIADR